MAGDLWAQEGVLGGHQGAWISEGCWGGLLDGPSQGLSLSGS